MHVFTRPREEAGRELSSSCSAAGRYKQHTMVENGLDRCCAHPQEERQQEAVMQLLG